MLVDIDINADLVRFFKEMTRTPFRYGDVDCALFTSNWFFRRRGVDPAAHLRGTYHDVSTCGEVLVANGGLLRLMWFMAKSVGMQRTKEPKPGDVALVRIRKLHFGAVMMPDGKWAIKMSHGMTATSSCKVVAAWSL